MKTILAIVFFITCLTASVHLLILLSSDLPFTIYNHLHAMLAIAVALFSGVGMWALTEIKPRGATRL